MEHHTAQVNGISMHYVESGKGPPVVLLHGFPETWFCWRHQIPALSSRYRLIVPDLRGYGRSAKPAAGYDKRTMANDILGLMQHCGCPTAVIVGHDRGARVATRLAKDHPEAVERLVVMDNIPTRIIFERMNAEIARGHWFFIFNNVPDLPEALITGREEVWLRFIFSTCVITPNSSRATRSPCTSKPIRSPAHFEARSAITGPAVKTSPRMNRIRMFSSPVPRSCSGAKTFLSVERCGTSAKSGTKWRAI
jgi:haloacetate dehalogenase